MTHKQVRLTDDEDHDRDLAPGERRQPPFAVVCAHGAVYPLEPVHAEVVPSDVWVCERKI